MKQAEALTQQQIKLREKLMHVPNPHFPNMRFDRKSTRQVFETVDLQSKRVSKRSKKEKQNGNPNA